MSRFSRALAGVIALALCATFTDAAFAQSTQNPQGFNPYQSVSLAVTSTSAAVQLPTSSSTNEVLICNTPTANAVATQLGQTPVYAILGTTSPTATVPSGAVPTTFTVNPGCAYYTLGANTWLAAITNASTSMATLTITTGVASSLYQPLIPVLTPATPIFPNIYATASVAGTLDLGTIAPSGAVIVVTGTNAITALGATAPVGSEYTLFFTAASSLTYAACSGTSACLSPSTAATQTNANGTVSKCWNPVLPNQWWCSKEHN